MEVIQAGDLMVVPCGEERWVFAGYGEAVLHLEVTARARGDDGRLALELVRPDGAVESRAEGDVSDRRQGHTLTLPIRDRDGFRDAHPPWLLHARADGRCAAIQMIVFYQAQSMFGP